MSSSDDDAGLPSTSRHKRRRLDGTQGCVAACSGATPVIITTTSPDTFLLQIICQGCCYAHHCTQFYGTIFGEVQCQTAPSPHRPMHTLFLAPTQTYEHVTVEPGPSLNLILGPNGMVQQLQHSLQHSPPHCADTPMFPPFHHPTQVLARAPLSVHYALALQAAQRYTHYVHHSTALLLHHHTHTHPTHRY